MLNDCNMLENIIGWIIESAVGIIGFIAVVCTLAAEKKIKKAEFVADYNFHFVTSEEFTDVEKILEAHCQIYNKLLNEGKEDGELLDAFGAKLKQTQLNSELESKFDKQGKDEEKISEQYQKVINYLVYLESFVPLITKQHVKLHDVDDLFGYRYFIAMNNPLIQQYELLPEAIYYKGCMSVYRQWRAYRKKHNLPIPMELFDLEKEANKHKDPWLIFDKNGNLMKDKNFIGTKKFFGFRFGKIIIQDPQYMTAPQKVSITLSEPDRKIRWKAIKYPLFSQYPTGKKVFFWAKAKRDLRYREKETQESNERSPAVTGNITLR